MKYKKPMCDCGEELLVYERIGTECKYNITKKGKREKKRIESKNSKVIEITYLECKLCGDAYELDWDIEDRIIRGGKIEQ